MKLLAVQFLCAWTSVIQSHAFTLPQVEPPTPRENRTAANLTRTSYSIVACYESLGAERPLGEAYEACSISECMNWAAGYKYFGFGCPKGNCFECRRGNIINAPSAVLGCQECGGRASAVHTCTGAAVAKYNGVDWLMGGWHRDSVYTHAAAGSQKAFCPKLTPTATPSPMPYPKSDPTPHPAPSPTHSGSIATRAAGAMTTGPIQATGDPHLQNVYGERFDLLRLGNHVLINIPRGQSVENALLRVEAAARQMGGQCADVYFQELNITGAWAEAKRMGGFRFRAQGARHDKHTWEHFGKVDLKVIHGLTQQGIQYLNFYVRNLKLSGFAVGGLLGEDDHTEAVTPIEACSRRLSLLQTSALIGQRERDLMVAAASFDGDF